MALIAVGVGEGRGAHANYVSAVVLVFSLLDNLLERVLGIVALNAEMTCKLKLRFAEYAPPVVVTEKTVSNLTGINIFDDLTTLVLNIKSFHAGFADLGIVLHTSIACSVD